VTDPRTDDSAQTSALLRAAVALLAAQYGASQSEGARPVEVVLAESGLGPSEIGRILGKKANTVTKTLSRAKFGPS
jgi:DNA-directed RNA polymerase specialized sigma24 family protein